MKDDFWSNFPPIPEFDCVEMKRQVQRRIYEETKHMTPQQISAYFRKKAESRTAMAVCETAEPYRTSETERKQP